MPTMINYNGELGTDARAQKMIMDVDMSQKYLYLDYLMQK